MGLRLGCAGPKALVELGGTPLLLRTLERFRPLGLLENAVIITPPDHIDAFAEVLAGALPKVEFRLVAGGAERQDSVGNGLDALDEDTEVVAIHDAARPFVAVESVAASIEAAQEHGASTVAIPCIDTILRSDADDFLCETPDRRELWACQTPQTFQTAVIREAHAAARADDFVGTDDASLVQRLGRPVKLVMGTALNLKVTTPEDLALAEMILERGLA